MNYQDLLDQLKQKFEIVGEIDLDEWNHADYADSRAKLEKSCLSVYKQEYLPNQRIVFKLVNGDSYVRSENVGLILRNLQVIVNECDISNFFVTVISSNPDLEQELKFIKNISEDPVPITGIKCDGDWKKTILKTHPHSHKEHYQYGSFNPIKISLSQISSREKFLLSESKTFCMYPWIHLHVWPTGQAFPCCQAEPSGQIGDSKKQTFEEIWNSDQLKILRSDMLAERPNSACTRCYEQEKSGFFSGRRSANKHHGHHISRALETDDDGSVDRFEMTYWDLRFSNLCNLRCRSCGHIFSSAWHQDQVKLAGPEWAKKHKPLFWAGRHQTDIWEQLLPHIDYVEQIYFAGGEPLMMDEHYRILEELERRERFDVRLIYNTNFTQTKLGDRYVFDYWKKFESVAVGASLDAMGMRAEYIRKGTDWGVVEDNRRRMMETCPNVDFYISPTLSIMNAWHLPDFHKNWVEKGLIRAQDLNVNILQDPEYYRIDIAPIKYKQRLRIKFEEHLEWLQGQDPLNRATVGFESAINFMTATDNTHLVEKFWAKTHELDTIRNENILLVIPELEALK
jgi:hypothetical protein